MPVLEFRVMGTQFPNDDGSDRQKIIKRCIEGEPLQLRHTPIPQDKNGVGVFRQSGERLGWVPKEYAKEIAYLLDRGETIPATFIRTALNSRAMMSPTTAIVSAVKPDIAPKGLTKQCGHCGETVGSESSKCPSCGRKICTNCGNPIGSGVTKCPKCGEATTIGGIQSLGCMLFIVGLSVIGMIILLVTCL